MVNLEADFNDDCSAVQFKDMKWKVPLAALKALQFEDDGKKFKLHIFFDLERLNKIMAMYGATKKQKKD